MVRVAGFQSAWLWEATENEVLMVLEDLDNSGFSKRRTSIGWNEVETCISWLANFHATFLHQKPEGLWETGTYWHLETRPEELEELTDFQLKSAAAAIDQKLSESPFQTFVHGDAKLANFCFSDTGHRVAAVDFQYVGGGLRNERSCIFYRQLHERKRKRTLRSTRILDYYFEKLKNALVGVQKAGSILMRLENNWRGLYHFAWADFHRFLKGWSPGHWKNQFVQRKSHPKSNPLNPTKMKLSLKDLEDLCIIAINAAQKAGNIIASYANTNIAVQNKAGGDSIASQVVTEVDVKSQKIIVNELRESMAKYDLALLTEESPDDNSRLEKDYFWCVDPMDGTLAFIERTPGFAVSIALVSRNGGSPTGCCLRSVNRNTLPCHKWSRCLQKQ